MIDEQVIDLNLLEEFKQYGEDGASILLEAIGLYLEDSQIQLKRLQENVLTMNATGIERAAHSLRGSSATLGATGLAQLCRALEEAAKGDLTDAGALYSRIEVATREAQLALKSQAEKLRSAFEHTDLY